MRKGLLLAVLVAFALPASAQASCFCVVTKKADTADGTCDSDCSLREAITAAAADNGADQITFDLSPWGVIKLGSPLPQVGPGDFLDGPLDQGQMVVEIDAGKPGVQPGLSLGPGAAVRRVAVTGADGSGIVLDGDRSSVTETLVGVDPQGTCKPNDIGVQVGGDNVSVGTSRDTGNLIRCNGIGVAGMSDADNLWLRGNTISGNQLGVRIEGSSGKLGSQLNANAANVVSGNSGLGVLYTGPGATNGRVLFNFLGTTTAGFDAPTSPNGAGAIAYADEASGNAAFANVIDAGSHLAISTGDTNGNAVANNDVATTFPFVYDGATEDVADGLSAGVFGPLSNGAVPFSIANRVPHTQVNIYARRGRCSGKRFLFKSLTFDSVITDDRGPADTIETDDAGAASENVVLPTPNKLAADDFIVGTTDDDLGTPDLRNPCPLPAADPGTPASPTPAATTAPAADTTAPSTTPVLPVVTATIPILNLANPFLRGFRIVPGLNGLALVVRNANGFPTAYDIEATIQLNLRLRAAKAGTFLLRAPRFTLAGGQSRTVRIAYSRAARRYLARKRPRRGRVTVKVVEHIASGASKAFTTAKTVTLKRPKRQRH